VAKEALSPAGRGLGEGVRPRRLAATAEPPHPSPLPPGRGGRDAGSRAFRSPRRPAHLERLGLLSPGSDILGLERISALLDRLGNPERALPPVLHVAGTNGKGSTCAFLRAAIEAAGLKTHVYSSPHLVRFNERIRLAGQLIETTSSPICLARRWTPPMEWS
jgi:hypothetical protein